MKLRNLKGSFHNHSTMSLIDGASSPTEMVKYSAEQGVSHFALSEHAHLSGLFEMEAACEKFGVQPIVGVEFYVDLLPDLKDYGHLTCHSYNDKGRANILKLYHESWTNLSTARFGKKKPQINWSLLEENCEGIFVGTSCLVGVVARCLMKGFPDLAIKNLDHLIAIYGKDHVFAEFIPHQVTHDYDRKTGLFVPNECRPWAPEGDLLKGFQQWLWEEAVVKRGLKPVTTLDAHFTTPEKKKIQDALLMNGETGWSFHASYHILSPEEIYNGLKYLPGHGEALHDAMIENALFFCQDVKYTKLEKKIHLAFEYKDIKESYGALAGAFDEDRINKICECHADQET